jgi:hypothetical protein
MRKLPFALLARLSAALLAVCLISSVALAQNPPASPAIPSQPVQPSAKSNPYDAVLARAAKLYYSTGKTGLDSFDCAVHPDWKALFVSAEKSSTATSDPRIALLDSVKITLHGRLKTAPSLDWNPPAAQDKDSIDLLDNMHKAVEQSLMGFMQFWMPFVDGSAVPTSSQDLEITRTEQGYKLHAVQGETTVTEMLDNQLLLKQFTVVMSTVTVNFVPAYKSTGQGLLVNNFVAHIQPAGIPPEQAQEMHVAIEYQTVDGFPIPARLAMNVVNSGELDFSLDGCAVTRSAK